MKKALHPNTEPHFLGNAGEMGKLILGFDWNNNPIGPVDQWPQSLRTTLGIVLHSAFPMFLFWGKERICFYNEAFRPSLGVDVKHPAIGKPASEVWPEIWKFTNSLIDQIYKTGSPQWFEDKLVPIYRNGRFEDVYWTFSHSRVYGDDDQIEGKVRREGKFYPLSGPTTYTSIKTRDWYPFIIPLPPMKQGQTIYVVDDDEDDRFLIKEAVESVLSTVKVIEFSNGIDFLDKVKEPGFLQGPVVVLMDINMPLMSGLEVISALRSQPVFKDLPILAISTASNPEFIKNALAKGASGYFTKPDSLNGIRQLALDIKQYFLEHF